MAMDVTDLYAGDGRSIKTFTLPVSGSILLCEPEVDIVSTAEFQRLSGLKQLGTSYVVFRGAIHTRFEHSLGTLHEATRMVKAINGNPRRIGAVDATGFRISRLGALLHDLTHIPFGHTLEDEFRLLARHDQNVFRTRTLLEDSDIGRILNGALGRDEYELLLKVLSAKTDEDILALGEYAYIADIIGNTLCADLLDYVRRDLSACGMPVALGDRFLDYLTITGPNEGRPGDRYRTALNIAKRGMPRPDVESEIVKLLSYRYELAERVYFHHAKNAASVMIGRAVVESGLARGTLCDPEVADANFHWLSDEMLLHAMSNEGMRDALALRRVGDGDPRLASSLATDVLHRKLFKIAYLAVDDDLAYGSKQIFERFKDPESRITLENELAAQTGLNPGDVLIHIPEPKMMTKQADIRVRTSRGEIVSMNDWDVRHSRRVTALNEAHTRLWRLAVYVRPEFASSHGALVQAAAESVFKAPTRYSDELSYSPLISRLFDQICLDEGHYRVDKQRVLSGIRSLDLSASRNEIEAAIRAQIELVREADASETGQDAD